MEIKWSLSLEAVSYLCFSSLNPFLMIAADQVQADESGPKINLIA
ncbi:hypothetical protein ABXT46_04245 [Candidatus Pelagibacter sp. Uisw_104]